ncbi:Superoxide dismutase-like protein YojM precursor [Tsuneonella dongtanensis]|uniref:Superoxide dismutase-like protein YojM n=1 Tax=Tsuneonella dongtanensis TaxID=692370 RepID=A0A1B2A9F9_9SPHN|nr:superoxide dismutase family protein [Tsuneonella dongtanensis]ANY18813.1 Superoxide dismutase-like protein YojM precursor [Tsuneonella dongtanensis]
MHTIVRLVAPLALVALAGCSTMADLPTERVAGASLALANGLPAGTVQILASGDRVTLSAVVTGIAPGMHGFHLHTTGRCTGPDFTSAGGHLNPLANQHGSANPAGSHVGDLPNLEVKSGGTGTLTADLPGTRAQVAEWLFDADGAAVVVHAEADDYRTDPTGNAGGRVACGVLKPA